MDLPLFHSSFPFDPSMAYSTAGVVRFPEEAANTTPFTMAGAIGEVMSREVQAFWSAGAPFCSTSFHAATALAVGTSSQRAPAASCQLASPAPFAPAAAGAANGADIFATST